MVSQKSVRTKRCALFRSCTHHKQELTIMHVMEISPLRVAIDIAQNARAMPGSDGSRRAVKSFCPRPTFM
jgi:hypothetical protein